MRNVISGVCAGVSAMVMLMMGVPAGTAQTRVPSRITAKIDDSRTVKLSGNVHPLAMAQNDRGMVADSQPMSRMLLLLQRSAAQEAALRQLMDAQQTKGSGSYHAWLTPEDFGKQFGPSDADMQAVTEWLTRQGFQVAKVSAGRTAIEFNGTVGQVRNAFHTEIHKFAVNGEEHVANASEPEIPAALAPVVAGVAALHNFPRRPQVHQKGLYRLQRDTGQIKPLFTFGDPANFAVGPGDFATIYNIPAGADGTGQTIAIVGQSNIDANDVIAFRNLFGLPANFTQAGNVIVNGPDPGLLLDTGDEGESDLDVEWAGAVAPKAKILFVTSSSTESNPGQITQGTDLSALYIIDNNIASVLSESYGNCEAGLGASGNLFFNNLWQQAAAEGITVVVATGDNGSAGCDPTQAHPNDATNGLAISGIASTPYNVAVGGTDFDASTLNNSTYWNLTNGALSSAKQYIPETTWDDSLCAFNFPAACNNVDQNGADVAAASGGGSNCVTFNGTNCKAGYALPAFQTNFHPTLYATVRTIPDVSLFASNGENGVALVVCEADTNPGGVSCNLNSPFTDFNLVGGTSASTPPFAAIVALLNQKTGGRQGNVNFGLYGLAALDAHYAGGQCNGSTPGTPPAAGCVFNDVTTGNIGVACLLGSTSIADGKTTWCAGTGNALGVTVSNGSVAYPATTGYDLATGLGSVNVTNLLNKWSTFVRTGTTTTLTNPTGGATSGQNFTATVTVTPTAASGDVSLNALSSNDPNSILASFGPFTLSNGTVSVQTNLLPPGTTWVSARYGGDATHAGSVGAPVLLAGAVAGANFQSSTQLNFVTFDNNGNPVPTTQSKTVTYGSDYILNILVKKSGDSGTCGFGMPNTKPSLPCPTGTITLTDGGAPLNDFANGPNGTTNQPKVSNQGMVEDFNVQLTGGSHTILATYTSGDTNYQNSTSNTLNVTITKATTSMLVASNIGSITSGESVTLTALVGSESNSGQGPTGTIQFQNGSTNIGSPATCTPSGATLNAGASCTATLTTSIAALYPPGTREPRPPMPWIPLAVAALSMLLFALGWRWMPEKRRRAYAYAGLLAFALLAVGIAGCGGGGGGGHSGHTVTIKAAYAGDTNYSSSSGSTTITVN